MASTIVEKPSTNDGFNHLLEGFFVDAKINTVETTKEDFLDILSISAVRFLTVKAILAWCFLWPCNLSTGGRITTTNFHSLLTA